MFPGEGKRREDGLETHHWSRDPIGLVALAVFLAGTALFLGAL